MIHQVAQFMDQREQEEAARIMNARVQVDANTADEWEDTTITVEHLALADNHSSR